MSMRLSVRKINSKSGSAPSRGDLWRNRASRPLDKQAGLGTDAAKALALHVAPGLGTKVMRHVPGLRRMAENHTANLVTTGVRHSISGKTIAPVATTTAKYMTGPEHVDTYTHAKSLLGKLDKHTASASAASGEKRMSRKQKERAAGMSISRAAREDPGTKNSPVNRRLRRAGIKLVRGKKSWVDKLPTLRKGEKPHVVRDRILPHAAGAAASVASPHVVGLHAGVNYLRVGASKLKVGKKLITNQAEKGFAGRKENKVMRHLRDVGVSHALSDAHNVGSSARALVSRGAEKATKEGIPVRKLLRSVTGKLQTTPSAARSAYKRAKATARITARRNAASGVRLTLRAKLALKTRDRLARVHRAA